MKCEDKDAAYEVDPFLGVGSGVGHGCSPGLLGLDSKVGQDAIPVRPSIPNEGEVTTASGGVNACGWALAPSCWCRFCRRRRRRTNKPMTKMSATPVHTPPTVAPMFVCFFVWGIWTASGPCVLEPSVEVVVVEVCDAIDIIGIPDTDIGELFINDGIVRFWMMR